MKWCGSGGSKWNIKVKWSVVERIRRQVASWDAETPLHLDTELPATIWYRTPIYTRARNVKGHALDLLFEPAHFSEANGQDGLWLCSSFNLSLSYVRFPNPISKTFVSASYHWESHPWLSWLSPPPFQTAYSEIPPTADLAVLRKELPFFGVE